MNREFDASNIKAVLLDLDGTLYRQAILRCLMAIEMLVLPLQIASIRRARKIWNAIYVFRKAREEIRDITYHDEELLTLEYSLPAQRLGMSEEELELIIQEWMYRRPLKYLKYCKREGLDSFFNQLAESEILIGILSDYPSEDKLKALKVYGDINLILSATDPDVNAFKPRTIGFSRACEVWGLEPNQVLYVGDRPEVDAVGAVEAGMPCVIIGNSKLPEGISLPPFFNVSSFSKLKTLFN